MLSDVIINGTTSVKNSLVTNGDGSVSYTFNNVTSNHTITASFTAIPPQSSTYTITFNPNGGSVSPTTKTVTSGLAYGTLPTPIKSGYTFGGWYTNTSYTTKITETTTVTASANNQTLYARWFNSDYVFTLTYDANGGKFDNGSTTNTIEYYCYQESVTEISKTSNIRDMQHIDGDYDEENINDKITIEGADSLMVTVYYSTFEEYDSIIIKDGDQNIIANLWGQPPTWISAEYKTDTYEIEGDTVYIQFNSDSIDNGGMGYYAEVTGMQTETAIVSGEYNEPTSVRPFTNWNTSATTGGSSYEKGQANIPRTTEDMTLYARWSGYLITYNANGGTFADGSTINQIGARKDEETRVSKTSNLPAEGSIPSGDYGDDSTGGADTYSNNLNINDVITIPGAKSLNVYVEYSTYEECDCVTIKDGAGWTVATLWGRPPTWISADYKTETFTIEGDTVYISFESDNLDECGIGYRATVTGDVVTMLGGEYKEPSRADGTFLGWDETAKETDITAEYKRGENNIPSEEKTLYATYKLNGTYVVTFQNNYTQTSSTKIIGPSTTTYGTLPTATSTFTSDDQYQDVFVFDGWYYTDSDTEEETQITQTTSIQTYSDHTIYAKYTYSHSLGGETGDDEGATYCAGAATNASATDQNNITYETCHLSGCSGTCRMTFRYCTVCGKNLWLIHICQSCGNTEYERYSALSDPPDHRHY